MVAVAVAVGWITGASAVTVIASDTDPRCNDRSTSPLLATARLAGLKPSRSAPSPER